LKVEVRKGKCFGCHLCEDFCSVELAGEINPKKAAIRIHGQFPIPGTYEVVVCDQCGDCAAACPVEAITESGGVYRIDPELCTGCGACVDACPRGAMFVHSSSPVPIKCVACGKCIELCSRKAIEIA
jgi:Fe-S-cluster-containing hydrogenase component 2